MSGKTATISQSVPAAGNLRIQTSVYGTAVPIVYGTARVSGNLAWFGGFQAIPHTSTTTSGGKGGGGVKTESTTYTYTAGVLMTLCEGPINGVLSAWKGKTRYSGVPGSAAAVTRTEGPYAVPPGGGTVQVTYGAGVFLSNVGASDQSLDLYDNNNFPQGG